MEGPIKSWFSVYLFVCPSAFRHFCQEWVVSFFRFLTMVDNWNISKLSEPFFPGKFIFPQIWVEIAQNNPKIGLLAFSEEFCVSLVHIVCTPTPLWFLQGVGVRVNGWSSNQIFKKAGGLTGPQLLEGGCWEWRGDFFQRSCNFHIYYYYIIISKNIIPCHN